MNCIGQIILLFKSVCDSKIKDKVFLNNETFIFLSVFSPLGDICKKQELKQSYH